MNSKRLLSFSQTQPLMATPMTILWFLLFFSIATAQRQQQQSIINLLSSLSPTTNPPSWKSSSDRFAFGFYPENNGFAVGVWLVGPSSANKTFVVWTANRDNPPVPSDAVLNFTSDGKLVLRIRDQETPISNATEAASSASMLDNGNFVLYNSNSKIIWQTFDSPTDTLLPEQPLLTNMKLLSSVSETNHSTGRYQLVMQGDGNLVIYPFGTMTSPGESIWSTATFDNNVTLHLDNQGRIFLVSTNGSYIKNITEALNPSNEMIIYRMTFDFGATLRLYSHRFQMNGDSTMSEEWPKTLKHCEIKYFCGINSYCTQTGTEAVCECPRGFDFIDQVQKFRGCLRTFTVEDCSGKKENMTYGIEPIKNTVWENSPYSLLSLSSEEECRQACLLDCNCEAAMFKDRVCSKQKLPLRYGIWKFDDSTTSLIKFGTGSSDGISKALPPIDINTRTQKELSLVILIVSIALMICSFVVLAISGLLIYRHRIKTYKLILETRNIDLPGEEFAPRRFTYRELEKATDGFKVELGKGGFGTVYRGALSNGNRMVAVKRLDRVMEEGEREFQTEMQAIGRTHHRNLVRLLGFCADGPHRLLVYEYMSNGSLADILFSPERRPSWNERVKIATDIARGILYLHEECETPIIHCDIKPQNILMDEFYCAKISDFGLAKLMKPDQTRTFTGIRGTRGYVAPEWHKNLPVTVKADVYSFGIVLLEIVCCRRNVDLKLKEEEKILCNWVCDCFEGGEIGKLVNCEEVDERRLEELVMVGLWCIQDRPSVRPTMKKVVLMLEGTIEIPLPPALSFLDTP